MEFPASYFQGEYREGFYVAPMMKRAWAAQMEVLLLFDEICDTYGLKWYIAYGTLLGAVRHKGFIPWDDDIDIWMFREDMMRLNDLPDEVFADWPVRSAGFYDPAAFLATRQFSQTWDSQGLSMKPVATWYRGVAEHHAGV